MVVFSPSTLFKDQYQALNDATQILVVTLCHRLLNWIHASWDEGCRVNAMALTVPVKDNMFMTFSYHVDNDTLVANKIQYD